MRSALVISPFATEPLDTLEHRRVHQTTQLLAAGGFRVTFVLLACNGIWRARHQDRDFERIREQWYDAIVVYGDVKIGSPPRQGERHQLDEWWDINLESMLRNLLRRRAFDVCVVHQVWLSRAFELLDRYPTVKILEASHTLSRSPAPGGGDCFRPDEATAIFGMERADLVIVDNEPDAAELARRIDKRIAHLPFYDAALERETGAATVLRTDVDLVRFGLLAERDGVANAELKALLSALETAIADTPAPIELVIAGAGDLPNTTVPLRILRTADTRAAFYGDVDCVIAPQFADARPGASAADAAALGIPLLVGARGAAGGLLPTAMRCDTAEEMAARMVQMSLAPPLLADAAAAAMVLRERLRARVAAGTSRLMEAARGATEPIVLDLGGADLSVHCLVLLGYLSYLRLLASYRNVVLVLPPDVIAALGPYLPPASIAVVPEALASVLGDVGGNPVRVSVRGATANGKAAADEHSRVVTDRRWAIRPDAGDAEQDAALAAWPLFHSNIEREPAALELRREWQRRNASLHHDASEPTRFLFVDRREGMAALPASDRGSQTRIVPLADDTAFRAAAMRLLAGGDAEIVWLAGRTGYHHQLIIQICALREIPLWGMLDEVGFCGGTLPRRAGAEFDRVCEAQLKFLAAGGDLPSSVRLKPTEVTRY
jgi:hypothetical protein